MNRSAKKQRQVAVTKPNDQGAVSAAPTIAAGRAGNTLAKLIADRAEFDILFIDPRQQITMLNEYYVDGPGTLDRCLTIHQVMAPVSVAVVLTRIRHLPVVVTEMLPRCGFSQIKRLPARKKSYGADLRNAEVIVVAERGRAALAAYDDNEWIELATTVDPIEFAELVYPSATRRLHAFANTQRPGWTTLPANSTWIEIPTLK